jgi:signal transduction histidine kinase/CheY-like chemotaxis protein
MRPKLLPALVLWRAHLGARLMLVFIGVALAPMLVGVLLSYQRARASLVDLALSKVEQEATLTAKNLGTSLEQFSSDILMLSSAPPVQGLLLAQDNGGRDPVTGRSSEEWIDWLRQLFATTIQSKQFYQQLRYLDVTGQELARIEYRDGTVIVVWAEKGGELEAYRFALENQASADYFIAAQRLPRGQIAISPLMLSPDGGSDNPPTPIIYFSTPIYDRSDKFRGVVVSTVYAASFLQRLSVTQGQVYLADQDGFYLAHPDPQRTFGRERGTGYTAAADFAHTYATLHNSGQDTATELDAAQAEVVALQKLHFDPLHPKRYWLLIRTLPEDAVLGPVRTLGGLVLGVALAVMCIVALLALRLARGFTRPIIELTGVAKQISQTDLPRLVESLGRVAAGDVTARFELSAQPVAVRSADEVGQLGRAFNAMTASLREAHIRLAQTQEHLRLQKEAAEAANQAKSTFLSNMSHELRTPLNAVLGFAQLLKLAPDATGQQIESLNIITRSGEHLLNLINNILDISKIESGHVLLEESATDLHQLIHEMRSLMYVKAKEKGLDFSLVQSPDFPRHAQVDAGKLRQVLINLLGNAIKFTQAGGVILQARVAAWMPGQSARIRFEVKDSGPGIQAEDLGRIFKPFEQLTNQHVTEPGTGLGLTICKQYVELMNGQLGVSSEPGKGSVFYFEIPVALLPDEEVPAESPRGRVIGIEEGSQGLRLLIVEDQPENRLLLFKLLQPLGFELRQASNGQEAVELFEQWHPHLIWMDIRMPVMDGREATRRIKQTETGANTKIIALTAHALEEERREILASGCDDFLRKPYRDWEIFAALTKHLGIRFRYADECHPGIEQKACALSVDQFDALPQEITNDLLKAVELLDSPRILEVIHRIGDMDQDLAMRLRDMVKNLQYKELLGVLDKLSKKEGE